MTAQANVYYTASLTVTPDDLATMANGSGATTFPWWQSIEVADNGDMTITSWDGLEEGGEYTKMSTLAEVVEALSAGVGIIPGFDEAVRDGSIAYLDAQGADVALQMIQFGDVVYG